MLNVNLQNVEELIFYDKKLQSLLPAFTQYFKQWELSIKAPILKQIGKRAILDFMNEVDDEHLQIIGKYLGARIKIDKLDYNIVKSYQLDVDKAKLDEVDTYPNFAIHRNADQLYISFWR